MSPLSQADRNLLRRETDIDTIASPLLRRFNDYWLRKRGGAAMPAWSQIDPAEVPDLLPNLIVVGVEHEPLRIHYRLIGTLVAEFRGDVTGLYLDSVPWNTPETRLSIQGSYAIAIATRAPTFVEMVVRTKAGGSRRVFGGIWPLAPGPEAQVDRCVALEDYGDLTVAEITQLPA